MAGKSESESRRCGEAAEENGDLRSPSILQGKASTVYNILVDIHNNLILFMPSVSYMLDYMGIS